MAHSEALPADDGTGERASEAFRNTRRLRNRQGESNHGQEYLGRRDDDEELLLWRGSFSWKGLIRELTLAFIATVVLGYLWSETDDPALKQFAGPAVAIIWIGLLLWLVYRKLDVAYRLTNQRLMHETGILYRRTHRIEVIDIDDLSFEQGIIERLINVGRIRIVTSDVTDRDLLLVGIDRPRDVYETLERSRRQERLRYGLHIEAV